MSQEQLQYHDRYTEYIKVLQQFHDDRGTSCIRNQSFPGYDGKTFVDIIIPAYNVEKYVDCCIKSVLKQKTRYSFRIIIVDDGAKDHTGEIIDRYQGIENVVIVHQENKGMAGARNTGLLHSRAQYIMFLDSDDCLTKDAIERLGSVIENDNVEISAGSYCNFKDFRFLRRTHYQKQGVLNSELELTGFPVAKLYRRELFEKVQFPEHYWFEDSLMQQIVFPQAKRIIGIRNTVYLRRINPGSITQNAAGNPKSLDSLWVTLRLMEDRETLGIGKNEIYYQYLLNQTRLNHIRLRGMKKEIQEAAFNVMAIRIAQLFPDRNHTVPGEEPFVQAIDEIDFERFAALCNV